jgi:hypothetical protein
VTDRTEIARHFVDSSKLFGYVSGGFFFWEGCRGGLRMFGMEWNRTADSRMVLTDRTDRTVDCRGRLATETRTGGSGLCTGVRQRDFVVC